MPVELEGAHGGENFRSFHQTALLQAVVTGTVGHGFMTKFQGIRRRDGQRLNDLSMTRQDVQDHIGGVDTFIERFRASGLDGWQTIAQYRGEDLDHLPVAIIAPAKLLPDPGQAGRQNPVLERCAVTKRTGLAGEHRPIVPGIVDCLTATEGSVVLGNDLAILADLNAIGIGADLGRDGRRHWP